MFDNDYEFVNEDVTITGSYSKNASTGVVVNVSGGVNKKDGEFIGSFSGYLRNGSICYTVNEMSSKDGDKVWDAIKEIEAEICTGQEQEGGEA